MITYSEKLATPEWSERREQIKSRDGFACVLCGAKKPLHVHHLRYVRGKEPWEYPDEALVTLCAQHHTAIHDETMRIQAENVMLSALRRAKITSLELIELTRVCLMYETEFSKRISKATSNTLFESFCVAGKGRNIVMSQPEPLTPKTTSGQAEGLAR